ncbi:hypothetical protein HSX11_27640 [Oxalobacteraceae bacterium]|nr:hypothetical protein [Oxalobacteraceae bacterium]
MASSKLILPALAALSLAGVGGCGGGGGGSSAGQTSTVPVPVTSSAQGAYQGTLSNGIEHFTLVLENDQFYTVYGSTGGGAFGVTGFLQGNGKSNNGNFSATDVKDATSTGQLLSGSLSASYTAGSSLNGTLTEGTNSATFTGATLPSAVYNYNTAASLNDISGSWNLTSLRGNASTFNIAASGAFTATSGACIFTGTFKPRSSGKNVFDVAITFGAAPCTLPGQTLNGIAVDYLLSNGQRQLIIAGLDQARTSSGAFFGVR